MTLQRIETNQLEMKQMLKDMKAQLDNIEEEVYRISKHVPFVDDLANSGVVRAVSKLNMVFSSAFLQDEPLPQLTHD